MRGRRRTNLLAGFVLLLVAATVMANGLGLIPNTLADVLARAWPALLIVFGLAWLLRERLPWGGALAILLSVSIVAGVAAYAFSTRAQQTRTDYRQSIDETVAFGLGLLRVRVATLDSDVEVLRAVGEGRVTGEFVGSIESTLDVDYTDHGDGSATLTITERRPNPFPDLEAVGRGSLRLELPSGVPLDLEVLGTSGNVTLNMSETMVERMNLDLARGNALVTVPEYAPVSAAAGQSQGTLAVRDGSITIVVPAAVAARLELDRGGRNVAPDYDPALYNFLFDRVLESRTIEIADIIVDYTIVAPSGGIRLEVPSGASAGGVPEPATG